MFEIVFDVGQEREKREKAADNLDEGRLTHLLPENQKAKRSEEIGGKGDAHGHQMG